MAQIVHRMLGTSPEEDWMGIRMGTLACENPIALTQYPSDFNDAEMQEGASAVIDSIEEMSDKAHMFMLGDASKIKKFPPKTLLVAMRRIARATVKGIERGAVHEVIMIYQPGRFAEIMMQAFNKAGISAARLKSFDTAQEAVDYILANCKDYNTLEKPNGTE